MGPTIWDPNVNVAYILMSLNADLCSQLNTGNAVRSLCLAVFVVYR
jgi:hypothetical protein